jgi:hypothetical protein
MTTNTFVDGSKTTARDFLCDSPLLVDRELALVQSAGTDIFFVRGLGHLNERILSRAKENEDTLRIKALQPR